MSLQQELKYPALLRSQCRINGEWTRGTGDDEPLPVTNPATGEMIGTVPRLSVGDIRDAISAAAAAWPGWKAKTAADRSVILRRWYDLIREHAGDLALILTTEQGKPLAEAEGEIAYASGFVEWFAEEGRRAYGDVIPPTAADHRLLVMREPVGVSAAITPWNFPAAMITRKASAALAAGCPMIVKPASATPLTALALGVLAEEAGIPAGVFQIVTGSASLIGEELTASPVVRKLSFTGSTEVGRRLMAQCADSVKRISLELGGNAPFIVFDDADLEAAVAGAMVAKYRHTGQTCVCANRFLVQNGVFEDFARRLSEEAAALSVGPGNTPGIQQGPLIDPGAVEKVEALIADATAKGADIWTGGSRHSLGGQFFEPTVIGNVTREMTISSEEIFGPVAPLYRFDTEEEAVEMANDTPFGLAAYFYTRDPARMFRVGAALESGMVGVNTGLVSNPVAPFGGVKQSGIGREGSRYGLDEYMELKYLCIGGVSPAP